MKAFRPALPIALLLVFSLTSSAQTDETIPLKEGWKFTIGDNLAYARPEFQDSLWKAIRVDKIWEEQGYDPYDGYAWYRIHVFLPSKLRTNAYLKDSLRIFLGKINNYDQSFLNGAIFGINGVDVPASTPIDTMFTKAEIGLWNVDRRYVLSVQDPRIHWDAENVIAVRVFDQGGQGGMWSGTASISMVPLREYLTIDCASHPFTFQASEVVKSIDVRNTASFMPLKGTLTITAANKLNDKQVLASKLPVTLPPLSGHSYDVRIPNQDQSAVVEYRFVFDPAVDEVTLREETPYILTPPPPAAPRINGAAVVGARQGRPFLFKVPATGLRPLAFTATGLPKGLSLNSRTGIISGSALEPSDYAVNVSVKNSAGTASRNLRIVIGNQIALTPPMGWNSWNCWGLSVDENKVLAAARAFVEKGLADHGWTYINIDDGWEIKGDSPDPKRSPEGTILTNEKFAHMKSLGDGVHALGLKLGIYSSPGPLTCGGYTASYQHEPQDARSWAGWGIDYVKYDWCSYDKIARDTSRAELMKPYLVMREALDHVDRDIVYSLCQYGMGNVWEWGAQVGGNLWRTTGDITDTWQSVSEIGFNQIANAPFAGPGHWNDPDMLVVGWVGWGPSLHPTQLTPDEQYTHISLWCLLSAPLLIGCDLQRLDAFTLNLLSNDEVLAIDQDALGKQAVPFIKEGDIQVWVKELADGGKAFGVFNLGAVSGRVTLDAQRLGVKPGTGVRDLWRQQDIGTLSPSMDVHVPSHGVALLKITSH